ncbi:hypothetical protein V8C34DRAFT_318930 [Trichoderma compactum]
MQLSIIRNLLLVVMTSSAYAARSGCNEGEVAVGTQQVCGIRSPRGGPSYHEDPCVGGPGNPGVKWIHPGTVGCTADGTPSLIQIEGGYFGNCRRVNSNCSPAPFIFQFASWCCPRL